MQHTTISISEDMQKDLQICKQETGMDMSRVLSTLYDSWRKGKVTIAALPKGNGFDGPLSKR